MDELIYKAKLAEQAARFDDMVAIMKEVVHHSSEMVEDQRNLFNTAYKNVIGEKRAAWRLIFAVENKEESRKRLKLAELARALRLQLEKELNDICKEAIELVDSILAKKRNLVESKVFFCKMKGDLYRYMAEYQFAGPNQTKYGPIALENAEKSYKQGIDIAVNDGMPSYHCIKLGLLLNYAVFHYEIKQNSDAARKIADEAFENALGEIENLEDEKYRNSLEIMQLIKDNSNLWKAEMSDQLDENPQVEEDAL